jgi:hypothetical protein
MYSYFETTHERVARALSGDFKLNLVSAGALFSNDGNFSLFTFCKLLLEHQKHAEDKSLTKANFSKMCDQAEAAGRKSKNCITIAQTPPESELDEHTCSILEGGIKHEVAHSKYTQRGVLKRKLLWDVVRQHYTPSVGYWRCLQDFYNIIEDEFVERKEIECHAGARFQIHSAHKYVMHLESRDVAECGERPLLSLVAECFRDQIKSRNYRPYELNVVEAYGQDLVSLVDKLLKTEIQAAQGNADSYEVFSQALRVSNQVLTYIPPDSPQEIPENTSDNAVDSVDSVDAADSVEPTYGDQESDSFSDDERELLSQMQRDNAPAAVTEMLEALSTLAETVLQETIRYSDYPHPLTTAFDTVEYVTETDQSAFESSRLAISAQVGYLRSHLVSVLKGAKRVRIQRNMSQGVFDSGSAHYVLSSPHSPACFKQRVKAPLLDTAVVLSLDESASMSVETARQILIGGAESCNLIGVPTFIFGWGNPTHCNTPETIKKIVEQAATNLTNQELVERYSRVDPVRFRVFKSWNESYWATQYRLGATRADSNTPLVEGIEFGVKACIARRESRKIVLVVTDGTPTYAGCDHSKDSLWFKDAKKASYTQLIRRMCREAADVGVRVIGVGVGSNENTDMLRECFNDDFINEVPDRVARALVQKLGDIVVDKRGM